MLSLASLIENIAFMLSASYFPYYAESLGAKIEYVGIFSAAFLVTSALLSQRFGGLSDRIGRKKLIQAGLLADVFLGILTGLLQNWTLLLVVRALNGIATAAVRAPAEASLIDQVPKHKKGEALGFFLTMSMIGWFAGPVFGGSVQLFAEKQMGLRLENSYRAPFFVDSLLAIVAMGLVAWKVKETRGSDVKPVELKENVIKLNGSVSRSLRVLYVTALANGFAIGFIALVGVLFFGGILNISPFETGLILSISGFVGIFCNFIGGKTADVIGRKPLIALGNLSSRLASIALPFSTNPIEATGIMIFRSLGINVAMPATHALRADLVPEEVRGKFFGRLQAFFNAGMIIGVLLGPWIFDRYKNEVFRITWPIEISIRGHGLPFFISAALGLIALALLLIFVEEPPRRTEKRKREG